MLGMFTPSASNGMRAGGGLGILQDTRKWRASTRKTDVWGARGTSPLLRGEGAPWRGPSGRGN